MPKGPPPGWKTPAAHTTEAKPYIAAAFRLGYETELTWGGIASKERALTCKRGLFNAARLHDPQVSVSVALEKDGSGWRLRYMLHDKKKARAYVVTKHGSDRSQWPYNARQRKGA